MTTTLIFVNTISAGRYHWGEQRRIAGTLHWVQTCGMSRRQGYTGSTTELTDDLRDRAQRYAASMICAKCFPGRILPTVESLRTGRPEAPQITAGARFSTAYETGCVAQTAPDVHGNFDGLDSEGVECQFILAMVTAVH